jgi:hypothetical protein
MCTWDYLVTITQRVVRNWALYTEEKGFDISGGWVERRQVMGR